VEKRGKDQSLSLYGAQHRRKVFEQEKARKLQTGGSEKGKSGRNQKGGSIEELESKWGFNNTISKA